MPTTDVICDASIVLKWFHDEGEQEVEEARTLLAAHRAGDVSAWILDLTYYELANVLLRALGWPSEDTADQLDDLRAICESLTPSPVDLRLAAELARKHELTFYDAAYAAVARSRRAPLATADQALLRAGEGEPVSKIVTRLGLSGSM